MEYLSLGDTPVNKLLRGNVHGWIQFKGSDLCVDIHCKCGEHSHVDGDFIYFVKCGKCGTIYELNGHIELIERDPESVDKDVNVFLMKDENENY